MPRFSRAEADGAAASSVSGWLYASTAEKTLQRLVGRWVDHMGSTYALRLDAEGVMEVRTTRPRGKTMRTRGIIRIQWKGDQGRVVWGRAGARALFTLAKLEDSALIWQSNRSKPFHWDRQEARGADEEDEEEEEEEAEGSAGSDAEDAWNWDAPHGGGGWEEEAWAEGWGGEDWGSGRRRAARRAEAWREGDWQEEGWEEEGWQEDDWEEGGWAEGKPEKEASDANPDRQRKQFRRQLQEARRQAEDTAVKPAPTEQRWKQGKADKPVYRKVERPAEPEGATSAAGAAQEVPQEAGRDKEAEAEAIRSMLGISGMRQKAASRKKGRREKAAAAELQQALPPSGCRVEAVPAGCPVAAAPSVGGGAGAADLRASAMDRPAQPGAPVAAGGQASSSGAGLGSEDADRAERLVYELAQVVADPASRHARPPPVAASPSNVPPAAAGTMVAPNSNAVYINCLEHQVQGFLGHPWFTPAWNSNNSGWAFDMQWVLGTLEWYFSDQNIASDVVLLQTMRSHDGWVPLNVLLACQRFQALGVNHPVLTQAIMAHATTELDGSGHWCRIRDVNRRRKWQLRQPA